MALQSGMIFIDHRAEVTEKVRAAAADALFAAAEDLLKTADETCPHRDGILQGSGRADVDEGALIAGCGYGGAASAYAARQHEEVTWHHKAGRRAKWLELALKENSTRLIEYVGTRMREALG